MKTKIELSVTISKEEQKAIEEVENLLERLCNTFDEHNQCNLCPIHSICSQQINNDTTLSNILYHIRNSLKVEEE